MVDLGKRISVLIVEDSLNLQNQYRQIMKDAPYRIECAASIRQARNLLADQAFGLILLDLSLPDGDGMELLDQYSESYRNRIIILTGHGSIQTTVAAMKKGAFDFLEKPVDPGHLLITLEKAADFYLLQNDHNHLKKAVSKESAFEQILGQSQLMKALLKKAEKLALTDHNLLISGETGTGKELLARAIHKASRRGQQKFITVNSATIPETLAESELFGFKKGAFTGAGNDYAGKFKIADGGTLFLDEIGELPLSVQAKLLRVLENKEITPLKGADTVSVDVRVLAATNRDLQAEVKAGRFREDLYYRINTLSLQLPPLRQRPEDIIPLIEHFLQIANIIGSTRVEKIDPAAAELLIRYDWPGNIRELKNLIMEMTALAEDEVIRAVDLPSRFHSIPESASETDDIGNDEHDPQLSLREVEMQYILSVLKKYGNNYKKCAEVLGLARSSLYRKLEDYGFNKGDSG